MFEQTFVDGPQRVSTRSASYLASLFAQAVGLIVLLGAPYVFTERLTMRTVADPLPPPLFSPTIRITDAQPATVVHHTAVIRPITDHVLHAPTTIPHMIPVSAPAPEHQGLVSTSDVSSASTGGVPWGVLNGVVSYGPPSIAPPMPMRLKVGGNVQSAKCVACEPPAYPKLAIVARIQGTVRMHAIIGRGGKIEDLSVISGPPMLITAAMTAVQNWRYAPTLLNGVPVEVDTIIDVHFNLDH
jgi:protein TonB